MEPVGILIVEDDHDSRKVLVAIISRKFPHSAVYSASDGKQGLEVFTEHTPRVVITDINMPEMNGYQMAHRIVSLQPETRFIALTADTEKSTPDEGATAFAFDHYILKPVNFSEIFAAVQDVIAS